MFKKFQKQLNEAFEAFKFTGIAAVIGFLGTFAGSQGTSLLWRRIAIPAIFVVVSFVKHHSFWSILMMSMAAFLSMGYGVPDMNDRGSTLGRFWYGIFKGNHLLTDIFTRGTVGLGIAMVFSISPILIKTSIIKYALGAIGIVFIYAFNSWRGYGSFLVDFHGKTYELTKVDMITYGVLGMCGLFIIL